MISNPEIKQLNFNGLACNDDKTCYNNGRLTFTLSIYFLSYTFILYFFSFFLLFLLCSVCFSYLLTYFILVCLYFYLIYVVLFCYLSVNFFSTILFSADFRCFCLIFIRKKIGEGLTRRA